MSLNAEKKPVLIAVSKEYFNRQVEKQLDSLVYADLKSNADSKGIINISNIITIILYIFYLFPIIHYGFSYIFFNSFSFFF